MASNCSSTRACPETVSCSSCHQLNRGEVDGQVASMCPVPHRRSGGGLMFQKIGQAVAWPNQQDQGRYNHTHDDADRMVFRVPSLRNVALTSPYFHDGLVANLDEAIKAMGAYELGIEINDTEVNPRMARHADRRGRDPQHHTSNAPEVIQLHHHSSW